MPYGKRDARQAAAGLSHVRSPSWRDDGSHLGLGEPGVDEGEGRPALGRRPLARAMVAEVVDVDPEHDRRLFGGRQRPERRPSARPCTGSSGRRRCAGSRGRSSSVGDHLAPAQPPLRWRARRTARARRRPATVTPPSPPRPARDRGSRWPPRPERPSRPPREGDDDPLELTKPRSQAVERRRHPPPSTARRMRLKALPFDSVLTTRTRPTSRSLPTWVPPSACLSRPDDVDDADLAH